MSDLKKGDIVVYKFDSFSGIGIINGRRSVNPNFWHLLCESSGPVSADVIVSEDQITKIDTNFNVFYLIKILLSNDIGLSARVKKLLEL